MMYRIIKPLSDLPPLTPKTVKVTAASTIDFVRQYNAICVNLNLHNHGGANATYRLNDEGDIVDLRATTGQENFENCHIEKLELITVSDVDILVVLAPIALLKKFNAIEGN